jgi:hypothetical protein
LQAKLDELIRSFTIADQVHRGRALT